MRKLTVKNFSVIKDAELEFGKITVLIGPQSSGKSLLCKLAYFLGGQIPGIAVESLLDKNPWDEFLQRVEREFGKQFLIADTDWVLDHTAVAFKSCEYEIQLHGPGTLLTSKVQFSFSDAFENLYKTLSRTPSKQTLDANLSRSELRQNLFIEISLVLNKRKTLSNSYIPSGRSLFSDAGTSIIALQNPDIDPITRRFAGLIAWDSRWKAGYLTTGRRIIQEIENEIYRIADGAVTIKDGRAYFRSNDGRNLPLSVQSSGTLELLPMLNVIDQLARFQEDINARTAANVIEHSPLVYLEEPEAHIFPRAQYQLIQLFAWLANDPVINFDWVITTHSPYILSSFNNLIEAGQVAKTNPELKNAVAKIVPEYCWIKDGDFKAYAIEGGYLQPILNDSGFIEGNYLDQVSEVIGNEFDALLRLEYDHTKAS